MSMHLSDFQNVAGTAAEWVGHAAIYGTVLAGMTWLLLRIPLRRSRLIVHSALWMIVLAKFLIPVGPSWSWSLATATRNLGQRIHGPREAPSAPQASAARAEML